MRWSRPISRRGRRASASSTPIGASVPSLSGRASMEIAREEPLPFDGKMLELANTEDVLKLGDRLDGVTLIILDFPKFTDGRAYTQARLLRERLGYTGELRASGA